MAPDSPSHTSNSTHKDQGVIALWGEKSISQYTFLKQHLEADSKIILSDIQRGQFNISKAKLFT